MGLIGQNKLKAKFDDYTIATLPRTILLCGDRGCGKHSFVRYIAEKFNLNLVHIEETISHEQLVEFSQRAIQTLYLIDLTNFIEKQQNKILKFIEEPTSFVHIILIAESESDILPTILNRCIKYYFEPYSTSELNTVLGITENLPDDFYQVCNTPGKLKCESVNSLQKLFDLCNLIVYHIKEASWANTLKIATQINYKEEYNKFDFNLFLDTLEFTALKAYKNDKFNDGLLLYMLVNKAKQQILNKNIIKENFMLYFLTTLWKEMH